MFTKHCLAYNCTYYLDNNSRYCLINTMSIKLNKLKNFHSKSDVVLYYRSCNTFFCKFAIVKSQISNCSVA